MKKYSPHRLMPLFVGAFLLLSLGGCATPNSPQDANVTDVVTTIEDNNMSELPTLQGQAIVQMTINGSPITIEIDGNNAPITGGNFVDLVDKGFYDGLTFHRVVKEPQPFVAQGGDPQGTGTGGYVDPETNQPRNIPLEITPAGAESPLYSKTFQQAGMSAQPQLQHTRGAIAMARSQMPDSASSQFYFTLADVSFLDGDYAVFGYVTEGMDVVEQINQGDTIDSAQVISGIENLSR